MAILAASRFASGVPSSHNSRIALSITSIGVIPAPTASCAMSAAFSILRAGRPPSPRSFSTTVAHSSLRRSSASAFVRIPLPSSGARNGWRSLARLFGLLLQGRSYRLARMRRDSGLEFSCSSLISFLRFGEPKGWPLACLLFGTVCHRSLLRLQPSQDLQP